MSEAGSSGRVDGGGAATLAPDGYQELRRLAEACFRGQPAGHTLQPTALVNEAWIKLAAGSPGRWADRTHFLAVAATAMRQILVDHARRRAAQKRGGGCDRITLDESDVGTPERDVELVALDEALIRLAEQDERKARVIELRFFAGLTIEQTADAMGVSAITVNRDWWLARAWIERELEPDDDQ